MDLKLTILQENKLSKNTIINFYLVILNQKGTLRDVEYLFCLRYFIEISLIKIIYD